MSKEEVIAAIRKCAEELGHAPSFPEVKRKTGVTRGKIKWLFGSYGMAVRACGMEHPCGEPVALEALFPEWARIARKLKRVPSIYEYSRESQHSPKPLVSRFKGWRGVPAGMLKYMEKQGIKNQWRDVVEAIRKDLALTWKRKAKPKSGPKRLKDRPTFGPPLFKSGMQCEPENENGVLVLFGMWAWRLGFAIKKVRPGFPDIIALRKIDEQTWQEVRVEVEQESRNFLKHGHSPSGADLIVCWIHNWPECPIEVIELSKVVW